jgi:2-hydroxy-6-oxonona-2,4-dienedioate hydrolase
VTGFWASLERTPHALRWADIDGVDTRILEVGERDAPPLVLLHGTGGHLEAFVHNVAGLARTHRVVAYDLPGHGWSAAPDRSYEIAGYARHLEALLDGLGIDAAAVVGQSLGGWVALHAAIEQPHRIRRLLLVGPGGTTMDPAVMARIREDSRDAVRNPTVESVRRRVRLLMPDPPDELVETRLRIYAQPGAEAAMEHLLCLQDPDVRRRNLLSDDDLRAVAQPALLVAGETDRVVPVEAVARIDELLSNSRLAVMAGCGHWPQFERPDEFNELATAFLDGRVAA